jgi:hypothetical protein
LGQQQNRAKENPGVPSAIRVDIGPLLAEAFTRGLDVGVGVEAYGDK